MDKKFLLAVVAAFVVVFLWGFLAHGVLLKPDYAALPNLYRTEQDQMAYMPWMTLAHLSLAIAIAWIYRRGREDKPWLAQGIRFGLAIVLLTSVPMFLIYYSVQPMPGMTVARQILFDGLGYVVTGVVVAWIYR